MFKLGSPAMEKMNPRPGPRSMLVMDNVRPHLPEDVAQMCEEAEVDLVYLLPYSPDLSPVSPSFHFSPRP
jgi:transposase